jgi:hypothetical protein
MGVRGVLLLTYCVVISACGSVPVTPESPQELFEETSLVTLPAEFRDAKVTNVFSDDLTNDAAGRFYPDFVRAQRFEYDNELISGHLIEYGSPVDLRVQHDRVFGRESAYRLDNDAPLLRRYSARLSIAQDSRPFLYLIAGHFVLHVTVSPDPANTEVAKFLALLFAEEVIMLNPEIMAPPPYYVSLDLATTPIPQWGALVFTSDDLIVNIVLDYTLLDADQGQITFSLERDVPFTSQRKVANVSRGTGTVSFVDTLLFSPDIPDTGANVTAKFVLVPPYIDDVYLGPGAAEYG